jgi:redox-sensitive bicupin YhaK (pirin superfamily)
MITLRRSEERGHADHGWLNTYHTFSFANYFDPDHMGFRTLRVLNDDRVVPGRGFGPHGHRDMEILSYVLEGSLSHKDSTGELHVLGPNMIQAMSAGSGVIHSEANASKTDPVHFLQIWIEPSVADAQPSYEQFAYDPEEKKGRLRLIAGPHKNGPERAAVIHQDAWIYASVLGPGQAVQQPLASARHAWLHVAQGNITLNGQPLKEGDGAAISGEKKLKLAGAAPLGGEFLLFDLP